MLHYLGLSTIRLRNFACGLRSSLLSLEIKNFGHHTHKFCGPEPVEQDAQLVFNLLAGHGLTSHTLNERNSRHALRSYQPTRNRPTRTQWYVHPKMSWSAP